VLLVKHLCYIKTYQNKIRTTKKITNALKYLDERSGETIDHTVHLNYLNKYQLKFSNRYLPNIMILLQFFRRNKDTFSFILNIEIIDIFKFTEYIISFY